MASNLLSAIRGQQPAPMGTEDESQKLATLLRAKSGKAVSSGDIAASSLGEQQAVSDANTQLAGIGQAAAIQTEGQAQQSAGIQQNLEQQTSDISQARRYDNLQNRIKTDALLSEFERNKGQLDLNRDRAKVEQLGINLRLQDKQYTDSLAREGATARLSDATRFREAMARTALGDNADIFRQELGNKSVLDASDREFARAMGSMSTERALEVFRNAMSASKEAGIYTGIAGVTTAGAGAAGKYEDSKSKAGSSSSTDPAER